MIEVQDVGHRYGSRPALEGVTLRVDSGSVVGLVGPNGAGKSTLLRSIATLVRPEKGSIRVAGHDARERPAEVRRALGFLPERANAYPDLTCWEYLDLFGEIAGLGHRLRIRRIEDALARAGLAERRDQLVGQLSKGLRQRLALQSVLLHDPAALALDEPTDGLDPESRAEVGGQIKALARTGRAVLVSSHALEELEQLADRTVALVRGRLIELRASAAPTWILQLRGDLPAARLVALGVPCVAEATVEQDRLVLQLREGSADAAEVTAALVQAGFAVVAVSRHAASLRDLYLQAVEVAP